MMHLEFRNVNDAFYALVRGFVTGDVPTRKSSSRNGDVLVVEEPVLLTYSHPRERVLFNGARDPNPFFHLYEALWMLAGRNDVAPLAYYVKDFAKFSDDNKTLNGAYGYRWRSSRTMTDPGKPYPDDRGIPTFSRVDQLDLIVAHLSDNPDSRRAVLQMWNVEDDLTKIGEICAECHGRGTIQDSYDRTVPCDCEGKLVGASKDVCCNLSVMFSLSPVADVNREPDVLGRQLDMTVTNRSNDMILGMLGANFVHFTFLQEYLAGRLGVKVGKYHHFTNNLHAYQNETWKANEWLQWYDSVQNDYYRDGDRHFLATELGVVSDSEIIAIAEEFTGQANTCAKPLYANRFLRNVAWPMLKAYDAHRTFRNSDRAEMFLGMMELGDWQTAARMWFSKRWK